MSKRTLGGTNRKAIRVSGFRAHVKKHIVEKIIRARRKKGRKKFKYLIKKIEKLMSFSKELNPIAKSSISSFIHLNV